MEAILEESVFVPEIVASPDVDPIESKRIELEKRYPHLENPYAALGDYIIKNYQNAVDVAINAGVYLSWNKRGEYVANGLDWLYYRDDKAKAVHAAKNFRAAKNDFIFFSKCVRSKGLYYRARSNLLGNIIFERDELKPRFKSEIERMVDVSTLTALCDYWDETLKELDNQAAGYCENTMPPLRKLGLK